MLFPDKNLDKSSKANLNMFGQTLTFKCLIIGSEESGKTSLIDRHVKNIFFEQYFPTVGSNELIMQIGTDSNPISLKVIETNLSSEYGRIPDVVFRDSSIVVYVCSYNDLHSFIYLRDELIPFINEFLGEDKYIGIIVITNSDVPIEERQFEYSEVQRLSKLLNTNVYEVSSKTGENVDRFFQDLSIEIKTLLASDKPSKNLTSIESLKTVELKHSFDSKKKKNCC